MMYVVKMKRENNYVKRLYKERSVFTTFNSHVSIIILFDVALQLTYIFKHLLSDKAESYNVRRLRKGQVPK